MRSIVVILLLLSSLVCAPARSQDRPLQLGVILPLSGKAASVGFSIRNGMEMAYQNLPEQTRSKLVLKFDDDAADSKQTVAAVQRLISEGGADVIVTAFSNAGNAVVPITEKSSVPLLSLAYDRGISNGRKFAFTFWVDVNDLALAADKEAARRGYKRIAVVSTLHEGNRAMREQLIRSADSTLEFPFQEEVLLTDTDLNSHVLRLKAAGPADAIALLMHGGHLGLFVKSLKANGVTLPLFTLGNFEDSGVRATAGKELLGQWYSAGEYAPWFMPAYTKKFPGDSTFGAAFGYDAVLLMSQAAAAGIRREQMAAFLSEASVKGGAFTEVTADGKNGFRFPVVIKTVGEDGVP